jgi:hypothetical protein
MNTYNIDSFDLSGFFALRTNSAIFTSSCGSSIPSGVGQLGSPNSLSNTFFLARASTTKLFKRCKFTSARLSIAPDMKVEVRVSAAAARRLRPGATT